MVQCTGCIDKIQKVAVFGFTAIDGTADEALHTHVQSTMYRHALHSSV